MKRFHPFCIYRSVKGMKLARMRANGEILGFGITLVIYFFLMMAIVLFSYYSIDSQQLTTATYSAGRAAAVSSDKSLAQARADAVLSYIYKNTPHQNTSASIQAPDGWKIGNMLYITVSIDAPNYLFFKGQSIQSTLAMMIEYDSQ